MTNIEKAQIEYNELLDWNTSQTLIITEQLKSNGKLGPGLGRDVNAEFLELDNEFNRRFGDIQSKYGIH